MYRHKSDVEKNKQKGWHMNLYRNKQRGFLGGVCAGLADHFEVDDWVVRLVTIASFLFLGGFILVAYVFLWWFLSPQPTQEQYHYEYDERHHTYRPKKMFKYTDSANVRLQRAKARLDDVTRRVTLMERHVTSKKFDLEREFSKIRD